MLYISKIFVLFQALVSADNYHAGLVNILESMLKHEGHHKIADLISVTAAEESRRQPMALDRDVLLMKATSTVLLQSLSTAYMQLHKYHQSSVSSLPQSMNYYYFYFSLIFKLYVLFVCHRRLFINWNTICRLFVEVSLL